jgi:hypothetical protein
MGKKVYTAMTSKELAAATAQFDRDFDDSQFKPLNTEQRARWQKIKRKRGRPVIGQGAKVISVSIEKGLLQRADQLAKRLKLSRASLITRGLENVLDIHGKKRSPTNSRRTSKAG